MFAHPPPHLHRGTSGHSRSWAYNAALAVAAVAAGLAIALTAQRLPLYEVSMTVSTRSSTGSSNGSSARVSTLEQARPVDGPPPVSSALMSRVPASTMRETGLAAVVTITLVAPEGMSITIVTLLDTSGARLSTQAPVDGIVRFDGLPAGTYQVAFQSETGVLAVGEGLISAAAVTPPVPTALPAGGSLVIIIHPSAIAVVRSAAPRSG